MQCEHGSYPIEELDWDKPHITEMAEAMLNNDLRSSPIPDLQLELKKSKRNSEEMSETKESSEKAEPPVTDSRKVQIVVPPKRPKLTQTVTAKQVIDAVSVSVSQQERLHALSEALLSFGHNIQCAHDEELASRADAVLTKHLGFVLFRKHHVEKMSGGNGQEPELSTEISQTIEILELLYRGSVKAVSNSFDSLNQELLPLLICILDDELSGRYTNEEKECDAKEKDLQSIASDGNSESNWEEKMAAVEAVEEPRSRSVTPPSPSFAAQNGRNDGDLTLRKATKILGHFARVEGATQRMAHHPGLLSSLISVITFTPYDAIPAEARLNSLWILGNLACSTENMVMMACHPGLLGTLVMTLLRTTQDEDSTEVRMEVLRSHSIAARALHNLSWAPENKIPLSENQNLVEALAMMVVHRDSPFEIRMRGVGDTMLQTRRHAVSALRQLALAPRRNKIRLCRHGNGKVLDNLTDAALNDPDEGVIEKALAAIHTLACVDTADAMMERRSLLGLLKDTMLLGDATESVNRRKSEASGTLLVLERSITEDMASFHTLRELLNSLRPPSDGKDSQGGETDGNESSNPSTY